MFGISLVLIICTACLLSFLLYQAFPHNTIIPYIPSILYMLGTIYLLTAVGKDQETMIWLLSMLLAAIASFASVVLLKRKNKEK